MLFVGERTKPGQQERTRTGPKSPLCQLRGDYRKRDIGFSLELYICDFRMLGRWHCCCLAGARSVGRGGGLTRVDSPPVLHRFRMPSVPHPEAKLRDGAPGIADRVRRCTWSYRRYARDAGCWGAVCAATLGLGPACPWRAGRLVPVCHREWAHLSAIVTRESRATICAARTSQGCAGAVPRGSAVCRRAIGRAIRL